MRANSSGAGLSMSMPFREKTAWIAVAAMGIAYSGYFIAVTVAPRSGEPHDTLTLLAFFALASAVRLLILGVAMLVVRAQSPADARFPADERDRAIAARSTAIAYWVLMTGMILVGIVMPFTDHGRAITNAALFWLVAAEIVRYGAAIAAYRRGWHG